MITNKQILTAETIPHVALDFMNNRHFEELEILNALGKLIEQGDDLAAITAAIVVWLEHTMAHFARENALMIEINFPMISMHSSEHSRVLLEMNTVSTTWQQTYDIDALADYVFSTWPNWFDTHVSSMDMITAKFAVMNGIDPHKLEQD